MLQKQPRSKWSDLDFALLEAYQVFEEEMGTGGVPIWLSRSMNPAVAIDIEDGIDLVEAAIEEHDKKNEKTRKPGYYRFPVVRMLDGTEAPEGGVARETYLMEDYELHKVVDADGEELDIEYIRPPGGYDPADYA